MKRTPKVLLVLGAVAALSILGASLAYGQDNGADTPVTDEPGVSAPGFAHNYDVLHKIRLELAEELGIDPLDVELQSLSDAGWDGCLGVVEDGQVCTEQFIAGLIAVFEAEGESYRYHIGGDRWVGPVDPEKADDGLPVEEMAADHGALLSEYARQELALRLDIGVDDLRVAYVIPAMFGDGCLGYAPDNARCAQLLVPVAGWLVGIENGGEVQLYSVTDHGVAWHDQDNGQTTVKVDEKLAELQEQLRADLAERLGISIDEVGVGSFARVTWSDGCLGVVQPHVSCMQGLTEGYLAFLVAEGRAYRYHGSADTFIAVDFAENVVGINPPIVDPTSLQEEIRADLAARLGVDVDEISVAEFREVTWSENCLGVIRIDALCLKEDVEGFLAFLKAPDGELYRYHGGNGTFVAVDFEEGIAGVHDPIK